MPKSLAPDALERALAYAAVLLACVVFAAVLRGMAEWGRVSPVVWLHLSTVLFALILTPVMLLRPRGDLLHRQLGWIWSAAMFGTAVISFGMRERGGAFSPIHILSVAVILFVPILVLSARRHNVRRHRRTARGIVIGALLVAGFFTFPFNRMLGRWLFEGGSVQQVEEAHR